MKLMREKIETNPTEGSQEFRQRLRKSRVQLSRASTVPIYLSSKAKSRERVAIKFFEIKSVEKLSESGRLRFSTVLAPYCSGYELLRVALQGE